MFIWLFVDYLVWITGPGKEGGEGRNVSHPLTNITLGGLTPESSYTVTVRASTIAGYGPITDESETTRPSPGLYSPL